MAVLYSWVSRFFAILLVVITFAGHAFAQTTFYPARGIYNGYLGQINIVECENTNSELVDLSLQLYSNSGVTLATIAFSIPSAGSRHIILNDLVQIQDSYGTYRLSLAAGQSARGVGLNCRTAFYRYAPTSSGKQFDYAYALSVQNPSSGSLSGIYNSYDPTGGSGITYNWLSIVNHDSRPLTAVVDVYSAAGSLLEQLPVNGLAPGARVDLALGHPRGQVAGLYAVRPLDATTLYDAVLIRYHLREVGRIHYAFPLRGTHGDCTGFPLLASTMGNGLTENWLEIANLNSFPLGVWVEVFDRSGSRVLRERREIAAYAQSHLYLSALIDPQRIGNVGSARVLCDQPDDRLAVQSSFYGKHTRTFSPEWAYASQSRADSLAIGDASLSVPANTFLGMANWFKIISAGIEPTTLAFDVYDPSGGVAASGSYTLQPGSSVDMPVHQYLAADTVGSVVAKSSFESAAFSGEILRVVPSRDGDIGSIMAIPAIAKQNGLDGSSQRGFFGHPQSLAPYREDLSDEEISHFLARASFGGSLQQRTKVRQQGLRVAVETLLTLAPSTAVDAQAYEWLDGSPEPQGNYVTWEGVRRYWMYQLRYSPNPTREKMALVLHDLLAASCRVVNNNDSQRRRCFEHVELIRRESFGNYRRLLRDMTIDFTMLHWLNNNKNRKEQPDENYAREHWELFTLGEPIKEGGRWMRYTDEDVAEAARAFTGWTTAKIDGDEVTAFVLARHDRGEKVLWRGTPFEVRGTFNYQDMNDLTLDVRPEAAQFVARRIFNAFVHDHPTPEVIQELAEVLRTHDWELLPVLRKVLRSEAMFSSAARHARVKDPVGYLIGFLRSTGLEFKIDRLEREISGMGLMITNPPSVKGWPGNKHGEAALTDYYLGWSPQYSNSIIEVLRYLSEFSSNQLSTLLPSPNANSASLVSHLSLLLDVQLSQIEREELIDYVDSYIDWQGVKRVRVFDPQNSAHLREKVAGLLWILAQHESYITH